VSRASALGVAKALSEAGHAVVCLELDVHLAESLRTGGYDVVFPVAHGAVGEDGSLQGLLEVLELPYVGSGVLASAVAMHKGVARTLLSAAGLPVADGIALGRGDARAAVEEVRRKVGARLVVKPASHGSAIGVCRLDENASPDEVSQALEAVWELDNVAVVEHFARGREVTCGVLELEQPVALPPTEILAPRDPFYNYQARYALGRSIHICPAELEPQIARKLREVAIAAHVALGCRDLSRVDFIVGDDGRPNHLTLLEVNTIPGMTATSLYPEAAAAHGLPMPSLCDLLVTRAHARGPTPRLRALPLPR
jgi:D-alanine-D-alanine ligase